MAASLALSAVLCVSAAHAQKKPVLAKLPDWSGIWAPADSNRNGGSGGSTGGILNLNAKITNPYSYTPAYQPLFEKVFKGERGEGPTYDPTTNCEPPGMPRLLMMPYPIEFMITPEKVVVLHEYEMQVRRIYTDGRQHPPEDELTASYNGHSIGHWEGDTLVIETVGLKDNTLLDRTNVHSDALRIVERLRRISADRLENQVTLTDAKAFTKAWTTTYSWERKIGEEWDLKEYICQENNRNASDETGKSGLTPSQIPK